MKLQVVESVVSMERLDISAQCTATKSLDNSTSAWVEYNVLEDL